MKSKRIKWLDFEKGILIFSVLLYHAVLSGGGGMINVFNNVSLLNNNANFITEILAAFMMPGFFVISGYLYKPSNTIHKYLLLIYKKFLSIMVPGIFFTLIGVSLQNYRLLIKVANRWYDLFICQYGDTWFLTTLFFVFLIVGLMDLLHFPLYIQLICVIIFYVTEGHFSSVMPNPYIIKNVIDGTPITTVKMYIIFFYLGYLFKKFNVAKYLYRYLITFVSFILMMLLAVIDFKYIHSKIVIKLLLVSMLFIVCIHFKENNYLFRFFTKYGKFTLIIYLVHWPIIYFVIPKFFLGFHLVNSFTNSVYFLVPCKIIIAWIVCIIICHISRHIRLINFIFYPRKYVSKLIMCTKWGKWLLNK